MELTLISRADAKAQGLKKYFTGKPCKWGHVGERYVSHRGCCGCESVNMRKWYVANRKHSAAYTRERTYRLPDSYLQQKFINQGSCCASCGDLIEFSSGDKKTSACVDHCHDTHVVGGILCGLCNTARGMLKESIARMKQLIAYQEYIEANHQTLLEEQLKIALPGSPLLRPSERHKHDTDQPLTTVNS